ncbi:hypothetical protein [Streptomyces sp. NBC_00620]|uniref:hypothetical protein n=1 Tax=Streptomyces sp. NBC_00620 TaxID=2903666 RepID=UPI00225BEB9B|nr:hypothetical protein [Streptomyces sp. NBC_00620]MCX4971297.1 hypothetical protein [Streptomyces sp. NBC_00620]
MVRNVWGRAAVASVMLALVAGCGSSEGAAELGAGAEGSAVTESTSASPSAAVSAVADTGSDPLTEAQLTKAQLEQGDLEGYNITAVASTDTEAPPIDADDDVCAAVSMMMFFSLSVTPEARVGRSVSGTSGDTAGTGTSVLLASYQEADANQGIADLAASVKGCPDGFEVTEDLKASAVKSLDTPDAGDEAVAFRLSGGMLGADTPTAYTVVRSGSTLAVFFTVDMTDPKTVTVPDEVVTAQLAKLEKTAG